MVGEVVTVRHGETAWSASGRHTGRTDVPLTDEGRRQAGLVGRRLAGRPFALVLSSPLSRALETCQRAGFGDVVVLDDDLMEWDYGEYEGLTTPEIRARREDWWLWSDGCPGGETPADVAVRADRVVARCRPVDGDVALFAHGHVLRVLGARWIEQPPVLGGALVLTTAAISSLGYERERAAITGWNDVSHLRA
jgi:probable phosphoglycerate mutase